MGALQDKLRPSDSHDRPCQARQITYGLAMELSQQIASENRLAGQALLFGQRRAGTGPEPAQHNWPPSPTLLKQIWQQLCQRSTVEHPNAAQPQLYVNRDNTTEAPFIVCIEDEETIILCRLMLAYQDKKMIFWLEEQLGQLLRARIVPIKSYATNGASDERYLAWKAYSRAV